MPQYLVHLSECSGHSASDDFDRFGGRETPTVLRRNSLSGGGEDSKRAVEELRQQLEITEVCTNRTTDGPSRMNTHEKRLLTANYFVSRR